MSSEITEALELLRRIAIAVETLTSRKNVPKTRKHLTTDEERTALAVVAVAKGANSFAAIARELGISSATARRNEGIRRALGSETRDRRVDKREAEDFEWHR